MSGPTGYQSDYGDAGETLPLASAGSRISARIIDTILQLAPIAAWFGWFLATFDIDIFSSSSGPNWSAIITLVLGLIWFVGYEFVQIAVWGQTLGKRVTSIKVVRSVDGGGPVGGRPSAAGRFFMGLSS